MNKSMTALSKNMVEGIRDTRIEMALFRIGLIGAGVLFLRMAIRLVTTAPLIHHSLYPFLVITLGGLGLMLLAIAGHRAPAVPWKWLVLIAVVLEVVLTCIIWRQTQQLNPFYKIDVALYVDVASELVQHAENPYAWDFNGVHELLRLEEAASTPQLDGSVTQVHPYPALSFLAVLPFDILGLPGDWLVPILAYIALACLLFLQAPDEVQPVVLFPLVVWFNFSAVTAIGSNDIVWAALLVAMLAAWRKPSLRAVLYGLAISYKQSPWLLFPFLVIRLWQGNGEDVPEEQRLGRVIHFLVISGLTFAMVNLPFILWDPVAWTQGVFSPMLGRLVYLSQGGLAGLTAFGYVNLPKSFYLLATLTMLGILIFSYWRHYATLRDTFVVFPAILMWFSYRTLVVYWAYWALPALAVILNRPPPVRTHRRAAWLDTMLAAAAAILILLMVGIWTAEEPPVVVESVPPYWTVDGQVERMKVQVENGSDSTIEPRFGVHSESTSFNPLPWYIESGPLTLEPGESALYQISSNGQLSFPASSPAQVVLTDAGGSYELRDVATIGPDRSFLWPDAIPNPSFLFWDSRNATPIFWGWQSLPAEAGSLSYAEQDGRQAVLLELNGPQRGPAHLALNSVVLMPRESFGIWVYPDVPQESGVEYGLGFQADNRTLILRFGTEARIERISEDSVIIERSVPTQTWTYQEIDLARLYQNIGWDLPDLEPHVYRRIDADLRTLDLSLFLSTDGVKDRAGVYFGPIEQEEFGVAPETLMAETLNDPAGYFVRLSERYIADRNYARALEALERAWELSPGDQPISDRMEALRHNLERDGSQ
jgi:hypothetical protein